MRAVSRELDAIAIHEASAARQTELAIVFEDRAAVSRDTNAREWALHLANEWRAKASSALDRAEEARRRLRADGFEVD